MKLDTHGRWPIVGAIGLAPVSVLALRQPRARPLAALLWHQTEEWVWPGGFLPWINREVIGADADEFPLTRRTALVVNTGFGWGLSVAPMAGPGAAGPTAALYVSHLGQIVMHVSWAVRNRRYDPGVVTSLATLAPVAVVGLRDLGRDEAVSGRALVAGVVAGTVASIAFLPAMRRRARNG